MDLSYRFRKRVRQRNALLHRVGPDPGLDQRPEYAMVRIRVCPGPLAAIKKRLSVQERHGDVHAASRKPLQSRHPFMGSRGRYHHQRRVGPDLGVKFCERVNQRHVALWPAGCDIARDRLKLAPAANTLWNVSATSVV